MGELEIKRWRRYGKDRLYVNDGEGTRLGWACLQTGVITTEDPDRRQELEAALAAHPLMAVASEARQEADPVLASPASVAADAPPAAPGEPDPCPDAPSASEWGPLGAPRSITPTDQPDVPYAVRIDHYDLSVHQAGRAVRSEAEAARRAAPVKTTIARLRGVHTDERAWRVGAKGEQLVGARLDALPEGWHVLHSVPVGTRGSDIDHVAFGPGGVFTINAKNHPDGTVWVGGNTVMVNGHRQPYVRNSRHEATRAARLLSDAVAWAVPVTGIIAIVGATTVTIKAQPDAGVAVVVRRKLDDWLLAQPVVLASSQVTETFTAARRSTTWR